MSSSLDRVRTVLSRLFRAPSMVLAPRARVKVENLAVELWVSQRKLPLALRADAIVVPVAPDLKMVFGIAKMVRDYGADAVQYEANRVAPLEPGDSFVGTGSKYRYAHTALAVVFDHQKRTSSELIARAISSALGKLGRAGARSVIFPDMTENLLSQPNWITDEQRRETAAISARLMLDAALLAGSDMRAIKIWVWDNRSADAFVQEMKKLQERRRAMAASSSV